MFEKTIDIERIEQLINLFGNFDQNIKLVEKKYNVTVTSHGSQIKVKGEVENVLNALRVIECLIAMINKGEQITDQAIEYACNLVDDGEDGKIDKLLSAAVASEVPRRYFLLIFPAQAFNNCFISL